MIRLRTFVILSSLFVVILALLFSWFQMKSVLEKGALTLEEKELDHISQVVRTAIEIKRSELRNYTQVVRSNNDLASAYLIGKESGDINLVDSKLLGIQRDLGFDLFEILTLRGKSIHAAPLGLDARTLAHILHNKEGSLSTDISGRPVLLSFAQLDLYHEPIAVIALGYFLDGKIAHDLSHFTSADIQFAIAPAHPGRDPKVVDASHNRLSFAIDGAGDSLWATISLKANPATSFWSPLSASLIFSGVITLALLLLALYCFLEFGFIRGFRTFVEELNSASLGIERGQPRNLSVSSSRIVESNTLFRACANLVKNLIAYEKRMKEQVILEEAARKQQALGELAQQVAHDIRSPLSALEVATQSVSEIPEENRLLIRGAVIRIQDIANNLLATRRQIERGGASTAGSDNVSVQLLSCLVESIVSEKRMPLRDRLDLRIETKLDPSSYRLFASVQPNAFKTDICSLLDNSVEAMDKGGTISVHLRDRGDKIELSVQDQGKGIEPDILPQLGVRGKSFHKEDKNGSGLGLHQARMNVEKWGGTFHISSKLGVGTTVTLALPKATPPSWFVPCIKVEHGRTIVVVDDDASIHQIWEKRFTSSLSERKPSIVDFSTPEQLRKWKAENPGIQALYLVDFEFLRKSESGLDLIESLGIEAQSILVTSRHEDSEVVQRCLLKNIRLIPKAMAGSVPLYFNDVASSSLDVRSTPSLQLVEGGCDAV